ncbi:MAG: mechanosensitive ion channel family protein [Deltaproteobacteria bacterium]
MGNLQVLIEPAKTVLTQITQFLLNALLVLVILLVGWLLSKLLKALVTKICKSSKLDDLSKKIEIDSMISKGGLHYSLSELMGLIIYWLGLLVTLVVAVNAIGLTQAADLLNQIVLFVPNIIAAVFILILGMFVATLLQTVVKTAASNAGLSHAAILSKAVEVIVVVFTVMISLEQLGIGQRIIELIVGIVLGSIGLAFALAFGFGCQDLAKKALSDSIEKLKAKKQA